MLHADIVYSRKDTTLQNTIGEYPIGTTATIYCNDEYYVPGNQDGFFESFCTTNREWDQKVHDCLPLPTEKHVGFIVGGTEIERKHVPFHIAIYKNFNKKWKYICGGTIIDTYMVVSAAHCFWNSKDGYFNDEKQFIVQAGTTHSDLNTFDPDNEDPQRKNIYKIIEPFGYVYGFPIILTNNF